MSRTVQIDIWVWRLEAAPAEREALFGLLSQQEQARALRIHSPADRDRWIIAHTRLRQQLALLTGQAPASLEFSTEPFGRPFLVGGAETPPSFNLSHSGDYAALAVSFDARVGVDIEAQRPISSDEIAFVLSEAELAALAGRDGEDRTSKFLQLWTLKEAFVKAVGSGVSLPFQDFDIGMTDAAPTLLRWAEGNDQRHDWRFACATPAPGYWGAVAAHTGDREMHVHWHTNCNHNRG